MPKKAVIGLHGTDWMISTQKLELLKRDCIIKRYGNISVPASDLLKLIDELIKLRGSKQNTFWDPHVNDPD